MTGSWPSIRRYDRDAWLEPKGRERRGRKESKTMTIDELIEQVNYRDDKRRGLDVSVIPVTLL